MKRLEAPGLEPGTNGLKGDQVSMPFDTESPKTSAVYVGIRLIARSADACVEVQKTPEKPQGRMGDAEARGSLAFFVGPTKPQSRTGVRSGAAVRPACMGSRAEGDSRSVAEYKRVGVSDDAR